MTRLSAYLTQEGEAVNLYDSRPYFVENEWNELGMLISIFKQMQNKKEKNVSPK